jgi:hypothetical protein
MKASAGKTRMPLPNTTDAEDMEFFVEKLNKASSDNAVWTCKRELNNGVESITVTMTSKELQNDNQN